MVLFTVDEGLEGGTRARRWTVDRNVVVPTNQREHVSVDVSLFSPSSHSQLQTHIRSRSDSRHHIDTHTDSHVDSDMGTDIGIAEVDGDRDAGHWATARRWK